MKELEQDLLKKVKNSDKDAFHQLFSNFYDSLFRFVVYKVKDSDLAEDISQETFLRFWTKIQQRVDKIGKVGTKSASRSSTRS